MSEHTYTPGQRVTVLDDDYPRYYIGTTRTGVIVTEDEDGNMTRWTSSAVAPYAEPEPAVTVVPDGWELIPSDQLEEDVHEIYDPYVPGNSWVDGGVRYVATSAFPILVVARRIEVTR